MTREIVDGIVVLSADEDKWLTNGETNSKRVYVGKNCSESEWREVDEPIEPEEYSDEDKAEAYDILVGGTS